MVRWVTQDVFPTRQPRHLVWSTFANNHFHFRLILITIFEAATNHCDIVKIVFLIAFAGMVLTAQ
jgi:hypothetical protein